MNGRESECVFVRERERERERKRERERCSIVISEQLCRSVKKMNCANSTRLSSRHWKKKKIDAWKIDQKLGLDKNDWNVFWMAASFIWFQYWPVEKIARKHKINNWPYQPPCHGSFAYCIESYVGLLKIFIWIQGSHLLRMRIIQSILHFVTRTFIIYKLYTKMIVQMHFNKVFATCSRISTHDLRIFLPRHCLSNGNLPLSDWTLA